MIALWQITAVLGALVGFGLFLLVREFVPGRPGLQGALDRLNGIDATTVSLTPGEAPSRTEQVGAWVHRNIPPVNIRALNPSNADLELIAMTRTSLLGEQAISALLMAVAIPAFTTMFVVVGVSVPFTVPVVISLIMLVIGWVLPPLRVKSAAQTARDEFSIAVGAYLELLAIERISGAGAASAAEGAARVGGSWPFQRISERLERARFSGTHSWKALDELADELEVPDLHNVADIMRLAAKEGASVYDQLRARAKSMRDAQLGIEEKRAAENSTRMTIPITCTAIVFILMLLYPLGSQIFAS